MRPHPHMCWLFSQSLMLLLPAAADDTVVIALSLALIQTIPTVCHFRCFQYNCSDSEFSDKNNWLSAQTVPYRKEKKKKTTTYLRFWNSVFHGSFYSFVYVLEFTRFMCDRNKYKTHYDATETSIENEWVSEMKWMETMKMIRTEHLTPLAVADFKIRNCFVCSRRICSHLHFCRIYILIHLLYRHNFQHVKLLKV